MLLVCLLNVALVILLFTVFLYTNNINNAVFLSPLCLAFLSLRDAAASFEALCSLCLRAVVQGQLAVKCEFEVSS